MFKLNLPLVSLLAFALASEAFCAWYWPFGSNDDTKYKKPEVPHTGKYYYDSTEPKDKLHPKQSEDNDISVDKVKELAEGGNPNAQLTLGKIYYDGLVGVKQDYKKAFKYFQLAASHGNPEAMYNLGICYDSGNGVGRPNPQQAFRWYQQAADAGIPEAQLKTAAYSEARGDAEMAFKYFKMMADDDEADCMYHVAVCMLNGYGTPVDPKGAVDYLLRAAESGHTRSQVKLADCYHQGLGVQCNYQEMANWLMVAAHSGDPEAQAKLGLCFQTGRGVEQNAEMAFKWYKIGAEADFVDAHYLLGNCYRDGVGTSKNYALALECYSKAAEKGDAMSQLELAEAYREGRGVTIDVDMAFEWMQKAADNGLGVAQARLGALLGNGTPKHPADPEGAVKWLNKALDGRQPLAVVQVAMCYLNGDGVPVNRELARRLLTDAMARGNKEAKAIYELYFLDGTGTEETK